MGLKARCTVVLQCQGAIHFAHVVFRSSLPLELECVAREHSRGHGAREFGVSFNLMTRSRGETEVGTYIRNRSVNN